MSNLTCPACVLVVEDDVDIREMIGEILQDEGYETALARDGQQALELLSTIPRPCLVLADLVMPVMDGWDLLRALSLDDRFATIPVVVMSGANNATFPTAAQVLKKPTDTSILLQIVHEHCCGRRREGHSPDQRDGSVSTNG